MNPVNYSSINDYLLEPAVRCPNKSAVIDKISLSKQGGAQNLLVVIDFDYTITRSRCDDGSLALMSDEVFNREIMTRNPSLHKKLEEMKNKYSPLEHDLHLSIQEKIPHMETWWYGVQQVIVQAGLNINSLKQSIGKLENFSFRTNVVVFFQKLESLEVPVVVYSAGYGDVIKTKFEENFPTGIPSNLHIISNWMTFDEKGDIIGFKPPLIHCFNKNANVIPKYAPFLPEIRQKSNVLLFGDNVGDADLWKGLVNDHANVLKVGFFNRKTEELVPKFSEVFDIVLADDQSFNIPNKLIAFICD